MSNTRKTRTTSTKSVENGSAQMPALSNAEANAEASAEDEMAVGKEVEGQQNSNLSQGKAALEQQNCNCKGGKAKCGRPLEEGVDCIMCDACEGWFHPKCQGVSSEAFKALAKFDLVFLCLECRPRLKEIVKIEKSMESRLDKTEQKIMAALDQLRPGRISEEMDSKIEVLEKKVVEEMRTHQVRIEATMKEQHEAMKDMPKFTDEIKNSANEIKNYVRVKEDKETREKNLILHNIPECVSDDPQRRKKYDHDSFQSVAQALVGEDTEVEVETVFRLGKKPAEENTGGRGAKPRLMLIKLKDKKDVEAIMRRRLKLKERGFENIYITRDLPPEEREKQKKLRLEWAEKGKKTHVIFQGKVVPRKEERGSERAY